ncbi:MAG TPA: PilZ domain-containing protein [Thermoanaerobaculia bacterium]
MTAIEHSPSLASMLPAPDERRSTPRHRVREAMTVIFGRGAGALVDISASGARIRHSAPALLGSRVRLSFEWQHQRFSATGLVLASRVIALGSVEGAPTLFESRLRFVALTSEAAEMLTRFMETIESRDLRKWIANLRGWSPEKERTSEEVSFIRCRRLFNHRWERKWTRDGSQPEDGFTVPSSIDEGELTMLCNMWERSDEDGREVLRQTARASVESSLA